MKLAISARRRPHSRSQRTPTVGQQLVPRGRPHLDQLVREDQRDPLPRRRHRIPQLVVAPAPRGRRPRVPRSASLLLSAGFFAAHPRADFRAVCGEAGGSDRRAVEEGVVAEVVGLWEAPFALNPALPAHSAERGTSDEETQK